MRASIKCMWVTLQWHGHDLMGCLCLCGFCCWFLFRCWGGEQGQLELHSVCGFCCSNKGNLNYTVFVGSAAVTQFWFHGNFVAEYVLFIQVVNNIKQGGFVGLCVAAQSWFGVFCYCFVHSGGKQTVRWGLGAVLQSHYPDLVFHSFRCNRMVFISCIAVTQSWFGVIVSFRWSAITVVFVGYTAVTQSWFDGYCFVHLGAEQSQAGGVCTLYFSDPILIWWLLFCSFRWWTATIR